MSITAYFFTFVKVLLLITMFSIFQKKALAIAQGGRTVLVLLTGNHGEHNGCVGMRGNPTNKPTTKQQL
jgi:hypothetical protein